MLEVTPEFSIPLEEISISYARSPGPGGQNVNKVSSKAILRWHILGRTDIPEEVIERFQKLFPSYLTKDGDVLLMGHETRDAIRNKEIVLEKLADMLRDAFSIPRKRIPTTPTRSSIRRRLADKAKQAEKKSFRKPPNAHDE